MDSAFVLSVANVERIRGVAIPPIRPFVPSMTDVVVRQEGTAAITVLKRTTVTRQTSATRRDPDPATHLDTLRICSSSSCNGSSHSRRCQAVCRRIARKNDRALTTRHRLNVEKCLWKSAFRLRFFRPLSLPSHRSM